MKNKFTIWPAATLGGVLLLAALPLTAFAQSNPSCILLGHLGIPCRPEGPAPTAPLNTAEAAMVSHSGVVWLVPDRFLEPVPGASSTLIRNRNGLTGSLTGSGLEPDTVYTLWWMVFNNPEHCATVPCGPDDLFNPDVEAGVFGGAGAVSDAYGRVHLQAHVFVGDDPGFDQPFAAFGVDSGLNDAFQAEVHLLNRSHGPVPDLFDGSGNLEAAFNTYLGGCTPAVDPLVYNPDDCHDPQSAVHFP